ncbi:cyanate MFS transporter [Rhodovulum sp. PH10]|uniref:MFS transporter n=1 Tax=Rhodovulum sp. PH10 TaxID=1187851 RepID=UPI00027C2813|nr:MFS transporter [Rhodovulum sp. PH10]EJW10714.1 cyanate MFS transporter [Rhodovulum sp. PH10]
MTPFPAARAVPHRSDSAAPPPEGVPPQGAPPEGAAPEGVTPAHATSSTPDAGPPPDHDRDRRGKSLRAVLREHPAWSVAAVVLIAFNLRPAITSVAPLLGAIRADLGLSGFATSVLTMAPVVCLGLFAPAAPPLVRRLGVEAVLLASLLGIVAGTVLRGFGVLPLFAGTIVIGASMSLLGVLAPVVVKRDFPHRIGPMMGLYTMTIGFGAAVSTATAVPLMAALGGSWQQALLVWGLSALLAGMVFIPQLFRRERVGGRARTHRKGLMRDPLAWQVTGYMALVSSLAYSVFAWGPTMVAARGLDPAAAGVMVSISYVAQMAGGFLAPMLAVRTRDQRPMAVLMVLMGLAGLTGYIFAPVGWLTGVSIVLGIGQGGAFGVALSLIVMRAGDQQVATQLSGLSQSVGYAVCGVLGPLMVGTIHDAAGWHAVAVYHLVLSVAALVAGLGAGRPKTIRLPG